MKQEEEQVKSNYDSLYIKRLASADALNAPLTHHLYGQFESWRHFASWGIEDEHGPGSRGPLCHPNCWVWVGRLCYVHEKH